MATRWGSFDLTKNSNAQKSAAGRPMGYVFAEEKRQHVVYRAEDNHVHEIAISPFAPNPKWADFDLFDNTPVDPPVGTSKPADAAGRAMGYVYTDEHTQYVTYRDGDGQIWELDFTLGKSTKWTASRLTSGNDSSTKAAGDPFGYFVSLPEEKRQHIVYRGQDGNVHELAKSLNDPRGSWGHFVLPSVSGVKAKGNPMGYAFPDEKRQYVVYRGDDDQIYALSYAFPNGPWQVKKLTPASGDTAKAASDPFGYYVSLPEEKRQHVVFQGQDGRIHELFKDANADSWGEARPGDKAVSIQPGGQVGAPNANGNPMGYVFPTDKSQHIVYRGEDDHVYQLVFTFGAGAAWKYERLTPDDDAKSNGDPMGYAFPDENRQHVVYRDKNNHVHELAL